MAIKHEAFLDLEAALEKRLLRSWDRYWLEKSRDIGFAVDDGEFTKAHGLVDELTLEPLLVRAQTYLDTITKASVLLGASRIRALNKTEMYKNPPKALMDQSKRQFNEILGVNGTAALRHIAHLYLDRYESEGRVEIEKARQLKKPAKGLRASTGRAARNLVSIATSAHVSRMSTAGALYEAASVGIQYYRISEVLDDRTCPVCERMHNQRFPVEVGLSQATNILSLTDPAALRQAAPWPSQSKASVRSLSRMTTAGLAEAGLAIPPYHARCRGIVVADGGVEVVDLGAGFAAGVAAGSALNISPENAGNQLFGDRSDLEIEADELFEEGQLASALYSPPTALTQGSLLLLGAAAGAATEEKVNGLPDPYEPNPLP